MTAVAVTGVSGYAGQLLLAALDRAEGVRRVVGIDLEPCPVSTRNMELYRMDIRSPSLADVLAGCDVVVHLAFQTHPRDPEQMFDANVNGTRNLLSAVAEAGVGRLVVLSDALVYGAHPDNDLPLTEASPIRPVREFAPSAQRAEVEELVSAFRQTHSSVAVAVLRPAFVCGPGIRGAEARTIEAPWMFFVEGYSPPLQVTHEDDLARALVFAVEWELDGMYNLCSPGWVSRERGAEILGQRRVSGTYDRTRGRIERLWSLGLHDLPPAGLPLLMYPCVMSGVTLQEAGFAPEHSNETALLAAAEARRGWVSIGRLRFNAPGVAVAGAATAAVAAGLALGGRRRRRHAGT